MTNVLSIRDDESKKYIGERFAPQPPSSKTNKKQIDLSIYEAPKIKDRAGNPLADFLYHKFLDLDTVDTDTKEFDQVGIKQGDKVDDEIDKMVDSLRMNGWAKEHELPFFDEEGHPIEGRVRTKSMKRKSQLVPTVYGVDARWMPISVFRWKKGVTLRQKTIFMERKNTEKNIYPHTIQNRSTFINAGAMLCSKGELDPFNIKDVDNYVRHESSAPDIFSDDGGNLAKIVNGIMKRGQASVNGVLNTKTLSRAGWVTKLEEDGYVLKNKKLVLTNADESTYAMRAFFEHIFPAIKEDKNPVEFILYTNKDDANEATESVKSFVKLMDKLWEDTFCGVNKTTKANFNTSDFDKPYNILGAVPQVIGRHDLDSIKLVPINKY